MDSAYKGNKQEMGIKKWISEFIAKLILILFIINRYYDMPLNLLPTFKPFMWVIEMQGGTLYMEDLKEVVKGLVAFPVEEEWFEFKENWFNANEIGECISSPQMSQQC